MIELQNFLYLNHIFFPDHFKLLPSITLQVSNKLLTMYCVVNFKFLIYTLKKKFLILPLNLKSAVLLSTKSLVASATLFVTFFILHAFIQNVLLFFYSRIVFFFQIYQLHNKSPKKQNSITFSLTFYG